VHKRVSQSIHASLSFVTQRESKRCDEAHNARSFFEVSYGHTQSG
jgi:hypothetical protein